jgi:hypothetical protein
MEFEAQPSKICGITLETSRFSEIFLGIFFVDFSKKKLKLPTIFLKDLLGKF